jgi:hypothetical protein
MNIAEMHCIKASTIHVNKFFSKQTLLIQEASSVEHPPLINITLLFTPPPPVNIFLYRNVRKKVRTSVVGRWRVFSFHAASWYLPISHSKKIIAPSSRNRICKNDSASLRLFCSVTRGSLHHAIRPISIKPLFSEQISPRGNALSRPVSPPSRSNSTRRESQMPLQQPTTFTTPNHVSGLIDRVLHLRHQLGIDIPLSVRDAEDLPHSPGELQASSKETARQASAAYHRRDWLVWSQSPGEGNVPEKEQEQENHS